MHTAQRLILLLTVGLLMVVGPVTLAAEAVASDSEIAVPGITTGVLLMGAIGIILIGGRAIARDSFKEEDAESE